MCDICGCGCWCGRNGCAGREGTVISIFMSRWNNGTMVFLMLSLVWSGLVWAKDLYMRGGRFVKSKSYKERVCRGSYWAFPWISSWGMCLLEYSRSDDVEHEILLLQLNVLCCVVYVEFNVHLYLLYPTYADLGKPLILHRLNSASDCTARTQPPAIYLIFTQSSTEPTSPDPAPLP